MDVKEHYDKHLGNFYSWMIGNFETNQNEFQVFLKENGLTPLASKIAIDLGAGHGIQSVALAKIGFEVIALDFNEQLLSELKLNSKGLSIQIFNEDIRKIKQFTYVEPELVICCGDTITHLSSKKEIESFISDISSILNYGGKVLLSFRDYSNELTGDDRFILVRSDETRILTCVLDYNKDSVRITDLLYERTEAGWKQKVSSYNKVRILENEMISILETNRLKIQLNKKLKGMINLIAVKS